MISAYEKSSTLLLLARFLQNVHRLLLFCIRSRELLFVVCDSCPHARTGPSLALRVGPPNLQTVIHYTALHVILPTMITIAHVLVLVPKSAWPPC